MRDATLYIDDKAVSHNNFNPRVLCGTRQRYAFEITVELIFQSMRPMRDATAVYGFLKTTIRFQSTRPMRDATLPDWESSKGAEFQSTRPMRDATNFSILADFSVSFQSTRPMRDATLQLL